jgi:sugar transferase (PEP-CTERM system associated)
VLIFRHHILLPILLLAGGEALVLVLSPLVIVALLPVPYVPTPRAAFMVEIAVFTLVAGLGFTAMGLYSRRQRTRLLGVLMRTAAALFAGVAAVALVSYLAPRFAIPRSVLGYGAVLAFAATALLRVAFEFLTKDDVFKRRVLIYGSGRRALSVSQLRRRTDTRGFHIVGFVRLDDERTLVPADRVVDVDRQLLAYCRVQEVHEIVVAMDDRRRAFPVHELLECRLNGIDIVDLVDFLERETGRVRLDVLNPSWIIFSRGFDRSRWRALTKRVFDVLASLFLLAIAWPFMLLTALAIKLEDGPGAPIIYRQRRVGLDNRPFDVFKFRSMRVDAERPGDAVWARQGDPRVTRVGALIRKVRIDELPQVMNVLYGDMSFVGPRPERPEFVSELENRIPYYRERHCVKPGITGWAQLCYPYGASEEDSAEKLQYDLYYVKNHSMLFDLMILLQTAEVVLWGQGAR